MSYFIKYQLSFVSDRNNIYDLHILQKNYGGQPIVKKLGTAPVLSIEEGEGRVKGSSLSFSIQADVEGELKGLYTTNNKEFKVLLYRNSSLYWQGFLLPELYSENYIDPPYDVAVTATDQLGVLKNIQYNQEKGNKSLLEIITYILTLTQLDLKIVQHLNLTISGNERFLSGAYVSTEGYYGQSCYDVLNSILLSCNTCIQQYENEWVIMSLTDATTAFVKDGAVVNIPHVQLGQMGNAQVYPDGSLEMVNRPALKGVSLNYAHILKNSFLKNADCESKDGWQYSFELTDNRFPGTVDEFGVLYKCNCWQLPQKDVAVNGALQLWQDVNVKADNTYNCQLSVDYRMDLGASLLLMAIIHEGADGVTRRLTSEGWKEGGSATDKNSYINVTGTPSELWLTWAKDISDFSKYEKATVQFQLPAVDGVLRIGFINTTDTGYVNPLSGYIYLTKVYLTYMGIAGKASTTVVEEDATNAQEEISLAYGERVPATNEALAVLNTLRSSNGIPMEQFNLNSTSGVKSYDSYFLAMLQEMSRYYAVKKMQLQGSVMGVSPLYLLYADVFSGKIMRLVSGEYDLLQDSVGILLEEVPDAWVDYETEVFATDNSVPGTSSSGVVTVGGGSGASLLAVNAKGEVYVKDDRVLSGVEADFSRVVLPDKKPAGSADKAYIYSQAPKIGEILDANAVNMQLVIDELVGLRDDFDALSDLLNDDVAGVINTWDEVVDFLNEYSESQDLASILSRMDADIDAVEKRVTTLEDLGLVRVKEGDSYYIKSIYSFVSEGEVISGRRASGSGSGGGGGISEITAQMITDALGYVPYSSLNPAGYITSAAIPTALKNPYALTINGHTYDGSEAVNITISAGGGVADSVDWFNVYNKPTTLRGYGITDAISTSGGTIAGAPAQITLRANTASSDSWVQFTDAETNDIYAVGLRRPADIYGLQYRINSDYYSVYHSGNFNPNDYLAKSGGFISSSGWRNQLNILRAEAGDSVIGFFNQNTDNYLGAIGFDNDTNLIVNVKNVGNANILHSSNYSSYALPLDGGTMKGNFTMSYNGSTGDYLSYGIYFQDYIYSAFLYTANGTLYYDATYNAKSRVVILSDNIKDYNAGSATKLQTGRYLWGNYFNGEQNISSALFLNSGGDGIYVDYNGINYHNSNNGWIATNINFQSNGGLWLSPYAGNVLIGATTDNSSGAKLQVNGGATFAADVNIYDINGVKTRLTQYTYDNIGRIYVYNETAAAYSDMRIGRDTTEGVVIQSNGNVLIGNPNDNGTKFQVNGAISATYSQFSHTTPIRFTSIGTGIYNISTIENSSSGFIIERARKTDSSSGAIIPFIISQRGGGVAAKFEGDNLIVSGEVISSRRASSSDARLKDNINRLIAEDCLAMVRNLQPSSWDWKENGEYSMGFIAQDVEQYMPYAVTRIKDEVLGQRLNLQYDQFFAPVVGAIQCLDIKVNSHEDEIESLKNEVAELKQRLSKYETVWQ